MLLSENVNMTDRSSMLPLQDNSRGVLTYFSVQTQDWAKSKEGFTVAVEFKIKQSRWHSGFDPSLGGRQRGHKATTAPFF